MRALWTALAVLMLNAGALEAGDAERPQGLMWNKTGLPLVFPLIVRSNEGQDFYMVLTDAKNDAPALAAYVRGGVFFRVLVPPGLFYLNFATGTQWQGENVLFGEGDTEFFALSDPLEFAIVDSRTKGGHIIDLTDFDGTSAAGIKASATYICQGTLPRSRDQATLPPAHVVENDPIGQDILKRRFERGENVFGTYDRQRQQDDFDPPVPGLPQVPLARPEQQKPFKAPVRQATRLYERPC